MAACLFGGQKRWWNYRRHSHARQVPGDRKIMSGEDVKLETISGSWGKDEQVFCLSVSPGLLRVADFLMPSSSPWRTCNCNRLQQWSSAHRVSLNTALNDARSLLFVCLVCRFSPDVARECQTTVGKKVHVILWSFSFGYWSVTHCTYPKADLFSSRPCFLSFPVSEEAQWMCS